MVPARRCGVVVLANRSGVAMTRTADAAIEAALKLPPAPAAPGPKLIPVIAADLTRFPGTYSQGPRQIAVAAKNGALLLTQAGRETSMTKLGDLEFAVGGTRYVFVTDPSGAVTFVHSGGRAWRKIK